MMVLDDKVDDWRPPETIRPPSPEIREMYRAGLDIPVEQCNEFMLSDYIGLPYDDWREL